MALILKDRVRESSTSSGTGSITLGGAFTGYQTFDAVIATGSTVYYTIHNLTAGDDDEWEVGLGTFTSPATLARTTVLSSSAGGTTKVNFTAGASGLDVFITQPAEEAVYLNQATGLVEIGGNGTNTVSFTNINTTNLTASTVTATTSNATTFNGTTGAFTNVSGNGVALTAINASNISSGTIANARTTASDANSASTIVARDANGSFGANIVTATFSGNGATLSAINASNISSGTIANARTTAASANGASTIVLRDSGGSFDANLVNAVSLSGNAATVTGINASNVSSGTIANARTTAATANGASTIVLRGASGEFAAGAITGTSFSGNGSAITAINASNVSSGILSATNGGTGSANLTADNVILGNGASAVKVIAPGTANNVLTSNGSTWISQAVAAGGTVIPAGTVMLFAQTSAPTGFTKNTTTGDNSALRVVTGTASTGGSVAFTTAFASQTPTGSVSTTVNNQTATNQAATATNQAITPSGSVSISSVSGSAGATTLSTPQIPSHTHTFGPLVKNYGGGPVPGIVNNGLSYLAAFNPNTGATGGGGSHTHPFSFSSGSGSFSGNSVTALQNSHNHTQDAHNHTASSSFTGNAINLAVQYIDVIRATKD
jgi:hypothetical protein